MPGAGSTGRNISIVAKDSFQAAGEFENPLVMNFANAHKPGGGFEMGATAQEMYRYNNSHVSSIESDYMLVSRVCVFRNEKCELLKQPFMTGVITVPAPN